MEGSLKEILFTLKDIRDGNFDDDVNSGSIFNKAKPAILNFPVLVSDLISLEDLTMINKALEREYATVVRIAMGLDDVMEDTTNGRRYNKIDYIKKFHTNDYTSKNRSFIYEMIEESNKNLIKSEELIIEEFDENKLIQENLGLNMKNLNDMTNAPDRYNLNIYQEAKHRINRETVDDSVTISSSTKRKNYDTERTVNHRYDYTLNNNGNGNGRNGNNGNGRANNRDDYLSNADVKETTYTRNGQTVTPKDNTVQVTKKTGGSKSLDQIEYEDKLEFDNYSKQLLDNDVKKANELIPTTLDITVYQPTGNGNEIITDHILLGVKCTSHKIRSKDMIDNIVDSLETKKGFFRFIQWTTGEIKFFKDYLLCLDTLKKEALRTRNKKDSTHWFRSLKNRSTISKIRSSFNLKNQLIPNCTLVLSMDEVDIIRNTYNYDLFRDLKLVQKLMDIYFLIGFVIVDASSEVAYFKFDGFKNYQTYSYTALERENRNQGNDIKSLVSLMSKF